MKVDTKVNRYDNMTLEELNKLQDRTRRNLMTSGAVTGLGLIGVGSKNARKNLSDSWIKGANYKNDKGSPWTKSALRNNHVKSFNNAAIQTGKTPIDEVRGKYLGLDEYPDSKLDAYEPVTSSYAKNARSIDSKGRALNIANDALTTSSNIATAAGTLGLIKNGISKVRIDRAIRRKLKSADSAMSSDLLNNMNDDQLKYIRNSASSQADTSLKSALIGLGANALSAGAAVAPMVSDKFRNSGLYRNPNLYHSLVNTGSLISGAGSLANTINVFQNLKTAKDAQKILEQRKLAASTSADDSADDSFENIL